MQRAVVDLRQIVWGKISKIINARKKAFFNPPTGPSVIKKNLQTNPHDTHVLKDNTIDSTHTNYNGPIINHRSDSCRGSNSETETKCHAVTSVKHIKVHDRLDDSSVNLSNTDFNDSKETSNSPEEDLVRDSDK